MEEFEALSAELHAHCYRMLGSVHDADDAVRETMARAMDRPDDPGSPRARLYTVATNRCLTMIEQRARREPPVDDTSWPEPYPDRRLGPEAHAVARESVELAFLVALRRLPGRQRAVLLLREALGFSARETAAVIGGSEASVNSALQRARGTLNAARPALTQQATLRRLGGSAVDRLARRYADAWQAGDVDAIVAMLAEDARYAMPPGPDRITGRARVRAFLAEGPLTYRWRFARVSANGQVAFATHLWDAERAAFVPGGLDVLTLRPDGTIAAVVAFLDADLAQFTDEVPPAAG